MTMSLAIVRAALDPEEPDYERAKSLGPEALGFLDELASGSDILLASKAIYLAGLINGDTSPAIVHRAALHENSVLRVAAAAAARYLSGAAGYKVISTLINDKDMGVQRVVLESLPSGVPGDVLARVELLSREHTEPEMRKIAMEVLGRRSLARGMGGEVQDVGAGGMGRIADGADSSIGMGLPNRGGGMGSLKFRGLTRANGMGSQDSIATDGSSASMGQKVQRSTEDSLISWERAALAWERAAMAQETVSVRKSSKKSCGCGSVSL